MARTAALTDAALTKHKPDLIIWPETAVPYALLQDNAVRAFVSRAVREWNAPLLTGMLDLRLYDDPAQRPPLLKYEDRDDETFNAAVLLTPDQKGRRPLQRPIRRGLETAPTGFGKEAGQRFSVTISDVYHKQRLFPFAERVPFVDQVPALSKLAIEVGVGGTNLGVGTEPTTFSFRDSHGEPVTVAAPICYDQLYPATMASFVRQGAQMLALITNEGWFSQTHGLYQLAAFTRLRAMETRRAIARCTNTGLTCVIDPWGRLSEPAPWWEATTLTGTVRLSKELTLYTRYTDYFPKACVGLALLLALAALIHKPWSLVIRHRSLTIDQ